MPSEIGRAGSLRTAWLVLHRWLGLAVFACSLDVRSADGMRTLRFDPGSSARAEQVRRPLPVVLVVRRSIAGPLTFDLRIALAVAG